MSDHFAPNEVTATSPKAIADELCGALLAFERLDYNAVTPAELQELLEARETIETICLRYRKQQESPTSRCADPTSEEDGDLESDDGD